MGVELSMVARMKPASQTASVSRASCELSTSEGRNTT